MSNPTRGLVATPIRTRPVGHDLLSASLRFASELIAWVATLLALLPYSIPLAIVAVLILIGLPAIFTTPGDRPGVNGPVGVPGAVTILLLLLQLVAATVAAWVIWPLWAAIAVTVVCLVVVVTEQPRWRVLTRRTSSRGSSGL